MDSLGETAVSDISHAVVEFWGGDGIDSLGETSESDTYGRILVWRRGVTG